jgi:hypothetical protein
MMQMPPQPSTTPTFEGNQQHTHTHIDVVVVVGI